MTAGDALTDDAAHCPGALRFVQEIVDSGRLMGDVNRDSNVVSVADGLSVHPAFPHVVPCVLGVQRKVEGSPFVDLTFCPDTTAVTMDDALYGSQTDPGTFEFIDTM